MSLNKENENKNYSYYASWCEGEQIIEDATM